MAHIYQVTYISKNTLDNVNIEDKRKIEAIWNTARKNNKKSGITGALLYSGGFFCEVLEGDKETVEKVIRKIESDSRHKEFTILSREFISNRTFLEWDAAFAGIDETLGFNIYGIKNSKEQLATKQTGEALLQALDKLIKYQEILSSFRASISTYAKSVC